MVRDEIWVICDNSIDCGQAHLKQIVSKAAALAAKGNELVCVVCIGLFVESQLRNLGAYGADKIMVCAQTGILNEVAFANILAEILSQAKPRLIMYPASPFGKAVAAYTSTKFESGLTADCIDIEVDHEGTVTFSRAAINSSVIARIVCINSEVQMCTVKKNVFPLLETPSKPLLEIEYLFIEQTHLNESPIFEVLGSEPNLEKENTEKLSDAKLIFAFGRGIENKENVSLFKRVAKKYNAQVAGTRAVIEEQLITRNLQIGQSGASVSPEIYIGFGISGATQHMVGIINSKLIIAVNKDENAPIFEYSDFAIIGDAIEVLSELDKLKEEEVR
jgi:electron transfer flavoprotein alpha subunit